MIYRNPYQGLSDAYSNCIATVSKYSPAYVFKGSRVQYVASVYHHLGQAFQNRDLNIANEIMRAGFYDVEVSNDMALVQLTAYNVFIKAAAPIDFSSINDIGSIFRGALSKLGFTINTDSIKFTYRPSFQDVCSGVASGASGSGDKGQVTAAPKSKNWFDNLSGTLGISSMALAAGVILGVVIITKR